MQSAITATADVRAAYPEVFRLACDIEAVAGRAVCIDFVTAANVTAVQAAAAAADQREAVKLQAADLVAANMAGEAPPRCLGCNQSIGRRPYAVVVVSAGVLEAPFLSGPVCTACGTEPAAIRCAAEPVLRLIWSGLHVLPPMVNAVGRA